MKQKDSKIIVDVITRSTGKVLHHAIPINVACDLIKADKPTTYSRFASKSNKKIVIGDYIITLVEDLRASDDRAKGFLAGDIASKFIVGNSYTIEHSSSKDDRITVPAEAILLQKLKDKALFDFGAYKETYTYFDLWNMGVCKGRRNKKK